MTNRTLLLALAATTLLANPASAQFSSDVPGVPRASVPVSGGKQLRTEWEVSGYKLKGNEGDTMAVGTRIGIGRSYRVKSNIEIGFDFTLLQGEFMRVPEDAADVDAPRTRAQGLALYGLRIGGKLRPYSDLSPEGYGVDLAVGASFGPPMKAVFGVERANDTTLTGGYAGGDSESTPLFNTLRSWVQVGAMASYRAQRFAVDAAIMSETADKSGTSATADVSPLPVYSGVSVRLGGTVRVTPSLALGASYWGDGAPPWRDAPAVGGPLQKHSQFGALLTLGSRPEAGTDIMLTSPNGSFSESLRLYVRWRNTN